MVYVSGMYSSGGVYYDIVAVDRTQEAIDSATRGVDNLGVHFDNTLTNIAFQFNMLSMAAQTAFYAIQESYNQTIGVAVAYEDQITGMHDMFGVSTDDAQKWRSATIATDTSLSDLSVTMRYVTQRVTDQSEAGEKYRESLKAIGVEAKDANGNWKDTSVLMQEILLGLKELPEGAERASAASDLLGRNWYRLADMIQKADIAVDTFNSTQSSMSPEDLDRIERFKIKWAQLAEKIDLAKANLGLWIIEEDEAGQAMEANSTVLDRLLAGRGLSSFVPDYYTDVDRKGVGADYTTAAQIAAAVAASQASSGTAAVATNPYLGLSETDAKIKLLSESTIPKLTKAWEDALATEKDVEQAAYNLAEAERQLQELQQSKSGETEKDRVDALVDSYKEYQDQIKKTTDLKKEQALVDAEYGYEMGMALSAGDVQQARSLTIAYNKAKLRSQSKMAETETSLANEANEFNQIRGGVPLAQVKGTTQYDKAQALVAGDLKIELNGVTLSKDYGLAELLADGKTLRQLRISMGGRTS